MILTALTVLAILALILTLTSAMGYTPIWVSVLLLCVLELVRALPFGR